MNHYRTANAAELIAGLTYPGRGIVIGTTPDGKHAVAAYFITGRSDNSRNRVFEITPEGGVRTKPFDCDKVEDPSLIIYNAVRPAGNSLVVTNGDQTDTVCEGLAAGKTFTEALAARRFEPDAPNFTPRISGILSFEGSFRYEMSILKSIDEDGTDCARYTFSYPSKAGLGHFIRTYEDDGNPLPTFCGEPVRIATENDIDVFTQAVWNALNENNRISLYVRYVSTESGRYEERLINKHQ